MRDILPDFVVDRLRERYLSAVADAENTFDMNSADEDSLTGALGQSIALPREQIFSTQEGRYIVDIGYTKLRGRGKDAPEKKFGSDGIFQIRILNEYGEVIRAKGLPFQSKKNWKGKNNTLKSQAENMERFTPGGIVIDFNHTGYEACSAKDVIQENGSKPQLKKSGKLHRLGQLLGNEFLDCKIGTLGLFFDKEIEQYKVSEDGIHIISTQIIMPN